MRVQAYAFLRRSAKPGALALLLALGACAKHPETAPPAPPRPTPAQQAPAAAHASVPEALDALAREGLAAERRALGALAADPSAPEAPALWLALAELYEEAGRIDEGLDAAANVLLHPDHRPEQAERAQALAERLLPAAGRAARLRWLLAAAHAFPGERRARMAEAARIADVPSWETLWADATLPRPELLALAEALGRRLALAGDRTALGRLAGALEALAPGSEAQRAVEGWLARTASPVRLGVLAADPYAGEDDAFLSGMARALAALGGDWAVAVEEVRDPYGVAPALARLRAQDAAAIVALAPPKEAQAMAAAWRDPRPLWLVSEARGLAAGRAAVFLDAGAPWTQAGQLAKLARRLGATRMLVLGVDAPPYRDEAAAFAEAFGTAGGEVAELDLVPPGERDIRRLLLEVRARTDDEALFFDLDLDAALFAPTDKVEPRLPPGFDGIYLAMPGNLVYLVAPQLAWAGLRGPLLVGSSSWDDGHLLDDRGRYLTGAVFCSYRVWQGLGPDAPRRRRLLDALGESAGGVLGAFAGRLGLAGAELARALDELEGFPSASGVLRMSAAHEVERATPCFTVHRGRVEPLSPADAPTAAGSPRDTYSPPGPRGRSAGTPPPPSP